MIEIKEKLGNFYIGKVHSSLINILHDKYQKAQPFPHIVIDNFLPPFFLDKVINAFPSKETASIFRKNSEQYLKRGYRPHKLTGNPCQHYLALLNSSTILDFLVGLTGIQGLIPDPYFEGGGLHETETGGYLDIHLDNTFNERLNLARRINMIIFLNKNWKPEYGGELELWDPKMLAKVKSCEPIYNRCVIFNTTNTSYHGQPNPVNCPPGMSRRSIALYYYSTIKNDGKQLLKETKWRSRSQKRSFSMKAIFNR